MKEINADKVLNALDVDSIDIKNTSTIPMELIQDLFENSHNHLPLFELFDKEVGLIGETYYSIKKFCTYSLMSLLQPTIEFRLGRDFYDNRINGLIVGGAGRGKGAIKNTIRRLYNGSYNEIQEISGVSHPEQLIGKKIVNKKIGETEIKGYFGAKGLFNDEANNLINEVDNFNAQSMALYRKAMDVFGQNLVEKKLVNNPTPFGYCPETRFLTFVHKIILTPKFFDTGSFRRYFCFNIFQRDNIKVEDSIKSMFADDEDFSKTMETISIEKTRMEYIGEKIKQNGFWFSKEAKDEISQWILQWNTFLCTHQNQSIRILGEKMFYSVKQYFVKIATILAISKEETEVSLETARQACFDCAHFLLNTINYYSTNSQISLSADIWHTGDSTKAMLLEWIHYKGATSEYESNIGIRNCQDAIGDLFGVNDRQSRSIFNKMKKEGLLKSKKGQHDSKVWLGFTPELSSIDVSKVKLPKRMEAQRIKDLFENFVESGRFGSGGGCLSLRDTHLFIFIFNYYIKNFTDTPTHCHSNHSTIPKNNTNWRLIDGEICVGRCSLCQQTTEIVAYKEVSGGRLFVCEKCFEKEEQ